MNVQRYTMSATDGRYQAPMVVWDWDINGDWVRFEDHESTLTALEAEVARLKEIGTVLRDATDELVIGHDTQAGGSPELIAAMNAWDKMTALAPAAQKDVPRG